MQSFNSYCFVTCFDMKESKDTQVIIFTYQGVLELQSTGPCKLNLVLKASFAI